MKKLILTLTVSILFFGCSSEKTALQQQETNIFTVKTQRVKTGQIEDSILLNGNVRAWEEANIFPRVHGKLLQNILKEGDKVSKGQNIATVDRDEIGVSYEPVLVPSTISGVIGKYYLDSGASVTVATPIALVVNQNKVRVLVDLPERYIGKIFLGQKAIFKVDAFEDKAFDAKVYKISPIINPYTRTVTLELEANNAQALLKSGMFAKVKLIFEIAKNTVILDNTYVLSEETTEGKTQDFVFTVTGNTVKKTPVKTGIKANNSVQIKEGLEEGQTVAEYVFGLKDGSKIKAEGK